MAERRMFAKSITNSAKFLRMPPSSRLLYYDLGMAADDDGIVEAFTVLRTTGAAEDDLRVLAAKGFVVVLNEDLVSYISAWNENNQIRKDRYKPSIYAPLLVRISDGNQMATIGIPDGNQMETQVSIGKDSIGKGSIVEVTADKPPRPRFSPPSVDAVREYCQEKGYAIDPERFVDHYTANGWKVGKNPMKDWKAAVRTWVKNEKGDKHGNNAENKFSTIGERIGVRL